MTLARHHMTPDEARSFEGYSVANAIAVKTALSDRGCSCEPYADVFTFNRWRAQGRSVRRGEHGIRLTVYVTSSPLAERIPAEESGPGELTGRVRSYPRTSFVFCRCQTEERDAPNPNRYIPGALTNPRLCSLCGAPAGESHRASCAYAYQGTV